MSEKTATILVAWRSEAVLRCTSEAGALSELMGYKY